MGAGYPLPVPTSPATWTTRASTTQPLLPSTVLVAVPARDEASIIDECLQSLDSAARDCGSPVVLVVVADACTDDTADVARRRLAAASPNRWHVVEGDWASASRARAVAIDVGLDSLGPASCRSVWIANTDADCTVPADWLTRQLRHADAGADAVAGIVRLDPAATCPQLLARFEDHYGFSGSAHRHVHAANLGLRADTYLRLGGWSARALLGEEHVLWRRLTSQGFRVCQPRDVTVTTSSRTVGRVRGGFATALARLAAGAGSPAGLSDHAGRSRLGSLATTVSYDSSMASQISSSGIALPTESVFQPERPM